MIERLLPVSRPGALVLGLAVAALARAQSAPVLAIPEGAQLIQAVPARGFQVYACHRSAGSAGPPQWVFTTPLAELFDGDAHRIGRHYAGPTWEFVDGSRIVGEVVTRAEAPDPQAIPWLLLKTRDASGSGPLAGTRLITRTDTVGGKAPEGNCQPGEEGNEYRAAYRANYRFYLLPKPQS